MNVSTDLVNWTYVGDAFPLDGGDIPDWIDPSAAFWAPDLVFDGGMAVAGAIGHLAEPAAEVVGHAAEGVFSFVLEIIAGLFDGS